MLMVLPYQHSLYPLAYIDHKGIFDANSACLEQLTNLLGEADKDRQLLLRWVLNLVDLWLSLRL